MAGRTGRLIPSAIFWLICLLMQPGLVSAEAKSLVLILDASGSMWGQVEGRNKIVIARAALDDLIRDLPDAAQTALITYGHRRKGDCKDIETLAPLGPIDKSRLMEMIDSLNPIGMTPLTDAVKAALSLVHSGENPTIILISDGLETCGGDPCKAVSEAKESGINFLLHVVGFGIEEENVVQLECAAQAGGGLYFDVKNAADLSVALAQAVAQPTAKTGGRLSIKTVANDQLSDTAITITRRGETATLAAGRTYTGPETNPRLFTLPAGEYDVTIRGLRFTGDAERRFEGVEIFAGESLERVVEFNTGKLSVKVVVNDKLGDAAVRVTRSGDGSAVAERRTYTSSQHNPALFELTAGTYDVSVKPLKSKGSVEKRLAKIEIGAGEAVEREVSYGTGKLSVKVTRNGELSDARVLVYQAGSDKPVAQGRTYANAKNNPKQFMLELGSYDVVVDSLEINGAPQPRFENIELDARSEATQAHNFESGSLELAALFDGLPVDAIFSVAAVDGGAPVASGRSYARSKALILAPGRYRVSVKGVKLKGDPKGEAEFTLETGQALQQRIELKAVE
ncbi:MAG: VWA domain-containing protein [Gammaproteobacteria bacterium]|nr:VWA domain-containing protein [Gammaproteobacteria bacterium]MCB1863379.1 VWA domain-containing protein [Gammaproteobacteria bacterium]